MDSDQSYMMRALELARKGQGHVHPNPLVGAVIVKDGQIIGEGYHQRYGESHAEVNALKDTSASPEDGVMYVNLEPCTYDGKTPPCVPRIIQSGIERVVIGIQDPNPKVNGLGVQQLREAGLEVETGICQEESSEINRGFIHGMNTGLPWVTLKLALTIDGFMAESSGNSQWITGEGSRQLVHQWRAEHNAILVGGGTVKADDPSLTVRMTEGANPTRVIVDPQQLAPSTAKVFTDDAVETVVISSDQSGNGEYDSSPNIKQYRIRSRDPYNIPWEKILKILYQNQNILSVFVEGGAGIASSLIQSGFVNELIIMTGPKILGRGLSPFQHIEFSLNDQPGWRIFETGRQGEDVYTRYRKEP